MKRLFGSLLLCGFLIASTAEAAKTKPAHPKVHQNKAAKKDAKRVKKENAKARKQARSRAKAAKKEQKKAV